MSAHTRPFVDRPWRTGRKLGRTIYAQFGPEPADDDVLIGMVDLVSVAEAIVDDHNEALARRWPEVRPEVSRGE